MIDLRQVQKIHERFLVHHHDMVGDVLEDAGQLARDHVRANSKFKRRTAEPNSLKDATKTQLIRTMSGAWLKIKSTKKYSKAIEHGSKPHIIMAKRGGVLAFRGRDGQMVFRRRVNHPGNRPFRFLYRATDASFRYAGKELRFGMDRVAKNF